MLQRPAIRRWAIITMLAALPWTNSSALYAQIAIAAPGEDTEVQSGTAPKGFAVLKADSKIIEMLDDFDRYAGKKSWELAFRALTSIGEANNRGMVPATDGFLVPIRARAQQSLLKLPPEGREAYRLFNDANAKQLWEHAQSGKGGIPADEVSTLRKLVDQYFLTSVGDLAADRLGDALFEQGDFAAAEGMWRTAAEKYPDPHLSPAKLQVKRGLALARLGRRDAVAALAAQVAEQFGDQRVTIGGRDVAAAEFVKSLISKESPVEPPQVAAAETVLLPTSDDPLWQIKIGALNTRGQIDPNTGMPMTNVHAMPNCAVEGNRFYANWLGTVYAADLETGKMLWRTGKFTENAQTAINYLQQGMSTDCFCLRPIGGKLLVLRPPTKNLLGEVLGIDSAQDVMLAVECLDAATGKTLWRAPRLDMTIVSAPYFLDGVGYLLGISSNNSTMHLIAIDVETGHRLWTVELGTPQNANNWRGGFSFGGPKILSGGGMLYIATNNGALLAVNIAGRQVEWALQHDTKPQMGNQRFWFNGMMVMPAETPGTLLDSDGVFYLKDASSRLMYVLDPAAPSIKWKRPISADETVVMISGGIAYLVGSEISALELKSRKLLWSTKLPQGHQSPSPLVGPEHIYVPTSRGIFDINPTNGDINRIFRGADRESGAARLLLAGDKLICVSDTAVTAYPIERAKAPKITSWTSQ